MEQHDGQNCTKWQNITVVGGKKNIYTFWWSEDEQRPFRYVMYGYDSLIGSHYDKYYIEYDNWQLSYNFSDADFTPEDKSKY